MTWLVVLGVMALLVAFFWSEYRDREKSRLAARPADWQAQCDRTEARLKAARQVREIEAEFPPVSPRPQ